MGVAMVSGEVIASFPTGCQDEPDGTLQPVHHVKCYVTSPPRFTSNGMMSKSVEGIVRAKCTLRSLGCVHTKPPLIQQLDGLVDQGVDPTPLMGQPM